jgi:hypothetical protein
VLLVMNWGTQVSTVIGAMVGVSATLLADRVRYRRDQASRSHETRRDLYVRYLTSLTESSTSIRLAVIKETDPAARYQVVLDAFRDSSVLSRRQEINLLAPADVKEKSDAAYRLLRQFRDLIETAPDLSLSSPEYVEALDRFDRARKDLEAAMRTRL